MVNASRMTGRLTGRPAERSARSAGERSTTTADSAPTATPWWRDAVIYQIYIRSFADGDGDGIGDLAGIRSRLPYLRDLGVDAIWITPFYPSPMADGGYDVADYRDIEPLFGTLADADALIGEAHDLGLRVIVDIVPNHSSDQHRVVPGGARRRPGQPGAGAVHLPAGPRRRRRSRPTDWESTFGGPAWTRLPDGDWYLHLFAPEQPDLELGEPRGRRGVRATSCGSGSTAASTASASTSPTR